MGIVNSMGRRYLLKKPFRQSLKSASIVFLRFQNMPPTGGPAVRHFFQPWLQMNANFPTWAICPPDFSGSQGAFHVNLYIYIPKVHQALSSCAPSIFWEREAAKTFEYSKSDDFKKLSVSTGPNSMFLLKENMVKRNC